MTDATPRTLTRTQLAHALGVTPQTVGRWAKQGLPCSDDGRYFDEAQARAWCALEGRRLPAPSPGDSTQGERPAPASVGSPTSFAKADLVRKVTQAKKSEMELVAEQALKDLGLDAKILAARSYEDYVAIDLEIGALLARGALHPARARAIQGVIADARQNTKAHLDAEGDEEPERLILLTGEGAELVRAFEGICSDERRQAILDYVHAEAEVDLEEFPNVDLARAAQEEEADSGQNGSAAQGQSEERT